MAEEVAHGMPGEYGALLEEALGGGSDRAAAPPPVPPTAEVGESASVDGSLLDSSLVVAVTARPTATAELMPMVEAVSAVRLGAPAELSPETVAGRNGFHPVPEATSCAAQGPEAPAADAEVMPMGVTVDPAGTGAAPRPTTVEGRVEMDAGWLDRPLLRQPVVLKPGASIGSPGGHSYIANYGSIPVTFVPSGSDPDPSAGTFFVDPAEVAAAAGPGGMLTDDLMVRLSGQAYDAGPPTAIQMAIIEAGRQAGLRFSGRAV